MQITNRTRLTRHAALRRLDYPVGSRARHRWKLIMYALLYEAQWNAIVRILKRERQVA